MQPDAIISAQQRQAFEPLLEVPPWHHLRVDTKGTAGAVADQVVRWLTHRAPPLC